MIDTHAHLTSGELLPKVEEILQRALDAGVQKIVNICTDQKTLDAGLLLHERYPWVYTTAATTPHDVVTEGEAFFPLVAKAAAENKLVAIGETGLDYFYTHSAPQTQRAFLQRYFALSIEMNLPLIFHCRDAFADLFAMADEAYVGKPGLVHCFTGTLEEAKQALDRGWYISLSGIVTFKKSEVLREVAAYIPLDRLFIETDAPYLAPQSRRGKQNEPSFIAETATMIAHVKGVDTSLVIEETAKNAEAFFSFSKRE